MGVTLYTSRVVLDKLGVVDYGLYGVVGGIVAMLSLSLIHILKCYKQNNRVYFEIPIK